MSIHEIHFAHRANDIAYGASCVLASLGKVAPQIKKFSTGAIAPAWRPPLPAIRRQIGWSRDVASGVKSLGPAAVMYQQSSSRMPNSPGM